MGLRAGPKDKTDLSLPQCVHFHSFRNQPSSLTALTGRSARVSPQAILRANSNPVLTPRNSQVRPLSCRAPLVRVEAPSSYFQWDCCLWYVFASVAASEHLTQARGVSPKRDPASASAPFSSPRLGEGGARLRKHVSLQRNPSA
ncbi:hypothetical protein DEO72_LG9g1314 [Vigna unguiculata]|uniref:Uncharacterized protein n=1 Tax=Vigna unguiculata TaxID=3917 RepID=A0A4D6MXY5_VIGUN|nr:hypothetical protein DEO72_LG9g1314 [Vigna unguiculata]